MFDRWKEREKKQEAGEKIPDAAAGSVRTRCVCARGCQNNGLSVNSESVRLGSGKGRKLLYAL
jgi:hypothetical protein